MSHIEHSSEVTEYPIQRFESNFSWTINNPLKLGGTIESKRIVIPSINGEWYFTVKLPDSSLLFRLLLNNYDKTKKLKDPNSKEDLCQISITSSANSKIWSQSQSITTNVINFDFQRFFDSYPENCTIEAKLTISRFQNMNSSLTVFENKFNKLSDDFGALMSDSTLSDFTIIVKSKEFKVHKLVLSVRSPVFNTMFKSNWKEAVHNKVEINDIESNTFEKLLIFIYCGKIPEDLDSYAMDLFVAADKYEVTELKNECEKYIFENVSKDNAMDVFNLSNLYSCNYDLKPLSFEIIKKKLQEPIIFGDFAEDLDAEKLQQLLEIKKSFETKATETFLKNEIRS